MGGLHPLAPPLHPLALPMHPHSLTAHPCRCFYWIDVFFDLGSISPPNLPPKKHQHLTKRERKTSISRCICLSFFCFVVVLFFLVFSRVVLFDRFFVAYVKTGCAHLTIDRSNPFFCVLFFGDRFLSCFLYSFFSLRCDPFSFGPLRWTDLNPRPFSNPPARLFHIPSVYSQSTFFTFSKFFH